MTGVKTVEVRGQVQIAFLLSMQPYLQPANSPGVLSVHRWPLLTLSFPWSMCQA